eukprot:scaffold427379_cov46-Prasinocladus_malaysianus.AAC.2
MGAGCSSLRGVVAPTGVPKGSRAPTGQAGTPPNRLRRQTSKKIRNQASKTLTGIGNLERHIKSSEGVALTEAFKQLL